MLAALWAPAPERSYPPSFLHSPGHLAPEARASIVPLLSWQPLWQPLMQLPLPSLGSLAATFLQSALRRCFHRLRPSLWLLPSCLLYLSKPPVLILAQAKQQRCPSRAFHSPAFWASVCVTGQAGAVGLWAQRPGDTSWMFLSLPLGTR